MRRRQRPRVRRGGPVRRRHDRRQRSHEVSPLDHDAARVDLGDARLALVDLREGAPQRPEGGLGGQGLQVGASVTRGPGGELRDERGGRPRRLCPAPGVDAQDLGAGRGVGQREQQLAVEAPRAAEGAVDGVDPVGRPDDDDGAAAVEALNGLFWDFFE